MRTYIKTSISAFQAVRQGSHMSGKIPYELSPERVEDLTKEGLADALYGYVYNETDQMASTLDLKTPGWEGVLEALRGRKERTALERANEIARTIDKLSTMDVDVPEEDLDRYHYFPYTRTPGGGLFRIDPKLDGVPEYEPALARFREALGRQAERFVERETRLARAREQEAALEKLQREQDAVAKAAAKAEQIMRFNEHIRMFSSDTSLGLPQALVRAAREGYDTRSSLYAFWGETCDGFIKEAVSTIPVETEYYPETNLCEDKNSPPCEDAYQVFDSLVEWFVQHSPCKDAVSSTIPRGIRFNPTATILGGYTVEVTGLYRINVEHDGPWQAAWKVRFEHEVLGVYEYFVSWDLSE